MEGLAFTSSRLVVEISGGHHCRTYTAPGSRIRIHLERIAASVARKLTWYRCRCPDVAKVKPKMIYASSKEELKLSLIHI